MFNYLSFLHSGISAPGASPAADGERLAAACLREIEKTGNPEQFPPRLLLLLLSPAFTELHAIQLAAAVRRAFHYYKSHAHHFSADEEPNVPLLGSSVAAVFYQKQVHHHGALPHLPGVALD